MDHMVQYLKKENARLQEALDQNAKKLRQTESLLQSIYISTALKYGTQRAPGVMEMVLNTRYEGEVAAGYKVTVTEHVDRNERVVRVWRV